MNELQLVYINDMNDWYPCSGCTSVSTTYTYTIGSYRKVVRKSHVNRIQYKPDHIHPIVLSLVKTHT